MFKLLRNREVLYLTLAMVAVTAAVSVAVSFVNSQAALVCAGLGFILIIVSLLFTWARYRRLAELAESIDLLLHGLDGTTFDAYREGELSILQTEIDKLVTRLNNQAASLTRDRQYLQEALADIAHQIRTPLTSIGILSTLLAKEQMTSEQRFQTLTEMDFLLNRIDWLVTALLKIASLDARGAVFVPQSITVEELIDTALEPFLITLELHDITVERELAGDVECDPSWTAEALGNIVKNCIEHLPDGGSIAIVSRQNSVYTQLTITDDGPGIHEDDLPHVFERFYRGQTAGASNYGIGLALSNMIIRQQNGTIKAEAVRPHGARFVIRFYRHQTL